MYMSLQLYLISIKFYHNHFASVEISVEHSGNLCYFYYIAIGTDDVCGGLVGDVGGGAAVLVQQPLHHLLVLCAEANQHHTQVLEYPEQVLLLLKPDTGRVKNLLQPAGEHKDKKVADFFCKHIIIIVGNYRVSQQGYLVSNVCCAHVIALSKKQAPFSMAVGTVELINECFPKY